MVRVIKQSRKIAKRGFSNILKGYKKTRYGQIHNVHGVKDTTDFKRYFPIMNYSTLNPYLVDVMKGNYEFILPEKRFFTL